MERVDGGVHKIRAQDKKGMIEAHQDERLVRKAERERAMDDGKTDTEEREEQRLIEL